MQNTIVDAYAHIGYPRYGTPGELASVWRQWGVDRGCIALPPGMPDFDGLRTAREILGPNVRLFGIPYGPDRDSRTELAEIQVRFGISGMRLAPDEILDNPGVLEILGRAGLCLMAIGIYSDSIVTRSMIDWLERFPSGTIAAPHFLRIGKGPSVAAGVADPGAFRDLLRHPRMNAIFSRHGGCSAERYPHADLRPWVDDILPLLTWERVMWGSELPVVYHRDEQVDTARDWLECLGVAMGSEEKSAYLGGNAGRLFFDSPAPPAEPVIFPGWVRQGLQSFIDSGDPVPVVRTDSLYLPLDLHGRLLSRYLEFQRSEPRMSFQEFLVRELERIVRTE